METKDKIKRAVCVSDDTKKYLSRLFRVTPRTVNKALSEWSNEGRCPRIRKAALERGGVVMATLPECETIHTWNGQMEQTFPNGAVLLIEKETGNYTVTRKGKLVKEGTVIGFIELDDLQAEVAALK